MIDQQLTELMEASGMVVYKTACGRFDARHIRFLACQGIGDTPVEALANFWHNFYTGKLPEHDTQLAWPRKRTLRLTPHASVNNN